MADPRLTPARGDIAAKHLEGQVQADRFVEGEDRKQQALLPSSLEDYVDEDNPARVVDVFVDELDLQALGFELVPAATGRPARTSRDAGGRRRAPSA